MLCPEADSKGTCCAYMYTHGNNENDFRGKQFRELGRGSLAGWGLQVQRNVSCLVVGSWASHVWVSAHHMHMEECISHLRFMGKECRRGVPSIGGLAYNHIGQDWHLYYTYLQYPGFVGGGGGGGGGRLLWDSKQMGMRLGQVCV